MESDCELKPKLNLQPDQKKSDKKKKSLRQKIKEFFTPEPERKGSEDWRNRDLENW